MPWIIDYQLVLERLQPRLKCYYHNSGAFGFPESARTAVQTVGWTGPDDPTIRPEMRACALSIPEPYEPTLATMATELWRDHLPGKAWLMPASHWAYELDHGSTEWLGAALERIGVDPGLLAGRNSAAAVEFSSEESELFHSFTQRLLERLLGSDFTLAFPSHPLIARLHHHKQLWWQTTDPDLAETLRSMAR